MLFQNNPPKPQEFPLLEPSQLLEGGKEAEGGLINEDVSSNDNSSILFDICEIADIIPHSQTLENAPSEPTSTPSTAVQVFQQPMPSQPIFTSGPSYMGQPSSQNLLQRTKR